MDKILVIGSNSFSGSHFVAEGLKNGYDVVGVSRSKEPHQVFLPYRWCNDHSQEALASERNFSFHQVDLNRNL